MKVVLKIGGSVLGSPPSATLVREYVKVIRRIRRQDHSIAAIVGGGPISRDYIGQAERLNLSKAERDWLAILVSRVNARFLIDALGGLPKVVPETVEALVEIFRTRKVAVMGGLKPGMTTDTVASLVAKAVNADVLVKASDQEGIYTSDPRKDPSSKKLERLSYGELKNLLAGEHEPGIHRILDPVAVEVLSRNKIRVVVLNGFHPENVLTAIEGTPVGTIIE